SVDPAEALRLQVPVRRLQGAGDEAVHRERLEVLRALAQVLQVQAAAFAGGDDEGGGAGGRRARPLDFGAGTEGAGGKLRHAARGRGGEFVEVTAQDADAQAREA